MIAGSETESSSPAALENALEQLEELSERIGRRTPFVFLDYDGTLTPIVSDPNEATLSKEARASVRRLSSVCSLAIVSGRDLGDVRALVGLDNTYYAGSHGFEIRTPSGEDIDLEEAWAHLPMLDRAASDLRHLLRGIPRAVVERKRFAIAVHYRNVRGPDQEAVRKIVDAVSRDHPGLRLSSGKKIYEFRPNLDWGKGKAVRRMLRLVDEGKAGRLPIYIGDDITDEDAFAEIRQDGLGILVRGEESRQSLAAYALDGPEEVRRFLDWLAERVEEEN